MKIGIYAEYLHLKDDISPLICKISKRCQVVVFVNHDQLEKAQELQGDIEIRLLQKTKINFLFRLLDRLLEKFLTLPKTKSSMLLSRTRIILSQNNSHIIRLIKLLMLRTSMKIPKFLNYDNLLNIGYAKTSVDIFDLDMFIWFTPVVDNKFMRQVNSCKQLNKFIFVHSWDHPFKFNRFPKQNFKYFAWNKAMQSDLYDQQNIKKENISIIGSSQFCNINSFFNDEVQLQEKSNYIYYPCFAGYEQMVILELEALRWLSDSVYVIDRNLKILVRPYPQVYDFSIYKRILGECDNIEIENIDSDQSLIHEFVKNKKEKFNFLKNALAVIHSGTTVGLETCYFETPSLLLDIENLDENTGPVTIKNASAQAHVIKHLKDKYPENTIKNFNDLNNVIKNPQQYLRMNRDYREETPLLSSEGIVKNIMDICVEKS